MDILSAREVRELDRKAIAGGKPGIELMESAGRGLVGVLAGKFPDLTEKKVAVFTGKGNNGGDGLVIARYLNRIKVAVDVIMFAGEKELAGDALENFRKAKKLAGMRFIDANKEPANSIRRNISDADIIVDAIFGTGFRGKCTGKLKDIIEVINAAPAQVVACDIPSGVNGDTGSVDGGTAVKADMTVTFAYPKKGLFLFPGSDFTGNVEVVDIGLKKEQTGKHDKLITREEARGVLVKSRKDVYKNDLGHLLVLAGSTGMTGAAALACMGALRSGAGLVTLGIPRSLNAVLEIKLTEAMTFPLPETMEGTLGLKAYKSILDFIRKKKVNVIAVGPGISTNAETCKLIRKLVNEVKLPCVLDADGINAFSGKVTELKKAKSRIVITPHPGELARLIKRNPGEIQKDRLKTAGNFAGKNGLICVLKGYQTVVSDGKHNWINSTGNPGMASGGTGDVLTGMIAGLLCRAPKEGLLKAAAAGVYLHGLAGDFACMKKGEASMIASDIIDEIHNAIKFIRKH